MPEQLQTAVFVVAALQLIVSFCLLIAMTYSLHHPGGAGQDHGQVPDEENPTMASERATSSGFRPTELRSLSPGPIPAERLSSVATQGDEEHQVFSRVASRISDGQHSSASQAPTP